jgi:benzylsuccinate CoA-transferase BbsE subunit
LEALGLGWEALRAERPRLIWCSLTPFGRTGPWAGFRAHDLVLVAMGGNAALTGDPDRAPVRCTLPTSYYAAGPDAAAGIAMALYARERSGRGQLVDVSMQECQLATIITAPGAYSMNRQLRSRTGARIGSTREIWRAKDGDVTFGLRGGAARIPSLIATVEWMDESGLAPAWLRELDWSEYNHNLLSAEEIARLEDAFSAFFATKTRRELFEQALARRIMLAPCNDAREILDQPQLRSRELFTTLEYPELGARIEHPEFFAKTSRGRVGIRRRAPRVGEHNAEIYGELGIDADSLRELASQGVI